MMMLISSPVISYSLCVTIVITLMRGIQRLTKNGHSVWKVLG